MKKLFNLMLILLFAFSLSACQKDKPDNGGNDDDNQQTVEKQVPEFMGTTKVELNLSYGKTFDPMTGIEVWANNNDISNLVIVTILDNMNNNEEVFEISLDYGGTYTINYYIPETQYTKKATFTRSVVVGCGYNDYSYDINNLTYKLVWSDEFDGTALDTSKWNYEIGNGAGGWGNNELQYYTNSTNNCYVEDGYLNIKAIKEKKLNFNYTSARITTKGHADYKYGRFEARIKLPSGRGIWPAFWMMPTNSVYGTWPNSGEIDIMEFVGYDPGKVHSTVHNELYNGAKGTQKGSNKYLGNTVSEDFHIYKVEWYPDMIVFYVDDILVFTYQPSNRTQANWPYDQKFFMILNVAVGGNWGGVMGVDDSIFPQSMVVDYVRVYQAEELKIFQ